MAPLLILNDIEKKFGSNIALNPLTLSFASGDRVLITGRNGAGKTTLLKIIAGLLRPDRGQIHHFGHSIDYCGEELLLYPNLSVVENLYLFASFLGRKSALYEVISKWRLSKVKRDKVKDLSKGTRARVSLSRVFLSDHQILLFDEPTSSFDDEICGLFRETLKEQTYNNRLCLITTFDFERLCSLPNRIIILNQGSLIDDVKVNNPKECREYLKEFSSRTPG